MLAKTLYGKVSNGKNSCWGCLSWEDKIKPVIKLSGVFHVFDSGRDEYICTYNRRSLWASSIDTINEVITTNNRSGALGSNILKKSRKDLSGYRCKWQCLHCHVQ
ncbi:MAG: hypothetical protein IPN46_12785 [Saprospiraceae bacterium]|nr:hypothetical protein [Saprospiraceae bacterium]